MKLANPKKFRKALKYLEGYLNTSSFGIEHYDEWREEVEACRKELDPKDWQQFDARVKKIEKPARAIYFTWKTFKIGEAAYLLDIDGEFDEIWEKTKVKKKAK